MEEILKIVIPEDWALAMNSASLWLYLAFQLTEKVFRAVMVVVIVFREVVDSEAVSFVDS